MCCIKQNPKKPSLLIFFLIYFILFIFAGFAKAEQLNWPVFQGNSARTGNAESGIPQKPELVWQLTVRDFKEKGIDPRGINRPIIYDNKVFISATEVIGLDLNTGSFLWRHKEEGLYPSSIVAGDGKIFAVFNDSSLLKNMNQGFIYALDEKTGNFLWKYQTQKPISHSAPLFKGDKFFMGDDSGTLYALDSKTGKLVWKKFLDAEVIHSSPAFYKGMIFVGTEGSGMSNALPSHLFALDAETGNIIWKFRVDFIFGKLNFVHGTPAISDDVVYFGSENGYFYALAYDSGKLIWKKRIASGDKFMEGVSAPPSLSGGKIFVTTWEGKLFSLEQKTGEMAWQKTFDKSGQGGDAAVITGSGLVCLTVDMKFSCLNENNGEIVWQKEFFGGTSAAASGLLVVPNMEIADGSPADTAVILVFSGAKKAGLPQIQKTDWLFFAIIIIGVCFLACLGLLIYKIMKNKTIIIILIVLGIVLVGLIGVYFIKQFGNTVQQSQNNAPANSASGEAEENQTPAENREGTESDTGSDTGASNQTNTEQPQNKIITDDFSIDIPAGWKQTAAPMGSSAMAINTNEQINDPAAQKINFKSYFAVSYDTLQGKSMSEYLQAVKGGLQQAISSVVFTKEQDMTINNRPAQAIEAELTQQGVDFKILMVVVGGQGEDVWVISFNTTKSSWDGYKETFYNIANSFR